MARSAVVTGVHDCLSFELDNERSSCRVRFGDRQPREEAMVRGALVTACAGGLRYQRDVLRSSSDLDRFDGGARVALQISTQRIRPANIYKT